jgi:hypothetical protein
LVDEGRSKLPVELDDNSWFRWMTKEKLRWGEVGREWLVLVDGKIKTSGVKLDESGWFWRTRKSRLRGDVGRESLVFRDEKGGTSTEVGREWLVSEDEKKKVVGTREEEDRRRSLLFACEGRRVWRR